MIWGDAKDMRYAVKRLKHFANLFVPDAPFTSLSPFGRNLALFYDFGDGELLGDLVLCAGAGRILANKCESVRVADDAGMQADIAAWWWRANRFCDAGKL